MKTIRCVLKRKKERALEGRHPWVFSGAIDRLDDGAAGDVVRVHSAGGAFLGVGTLNPGSQIAVRMLAFEDVAIDADFFAARIRRALALRKRFCPPDTDACRLVHSEGDSLPGLIVDRYGDFLVAQFLTAGMDAWKGVLIDALRREFPARGIFEKDDSELREKEGLPRRVGALAGEDPPERVEVLEHGLRFTVDIRTGQKTGLFLDQRENRLLVGKLAAGRRVLNCFAYSGGFSVYAAKGGAVETVSVDTSGPALEAARGNFALNGLDPGKEKFVQEDVFDHLRGRAPGSNLIILDPPAFAHRKDQVQRACRGYKDINLQALKLLPPDGLLFTFSCSSFISADLFQKIVFGAAKDAGRELRILAKLSHPFDHPISIYHPEGEYLKGLLCAC